MDKEKLKELGLWDVVYDKGGFNGHFGKIYLKDDTILVSFLASISGIVPMLKKKGAKQYDNGNCQ